MKYIKTNKGEFLFVVIPNSSILFVCDMGYLIFKKPAYENWVTDEELSNPLKLEKYLKRAEGKDDWKQAAIKLPDGDYKFMAVTSSFVTDKHEASQNLTEEIAAQIVDDNGMGCWDNYRLKKDNKYTCTSAMNSFSCLLETSNMDAKECYAILKNVR